MKSTKFAFWIVIVAISVALIGFTAWVAKNSTEYRSRAATPKETIYKAWEFKSDIEGWTLTNLTGVRVTDGVLRATFSKAGGTSKAYVTNTAVATTLPYGAKSLRMRLSVDTPTKDGRGIPATVMYWMKGKPSKPLSFTVLQGQLTEMTLRFPEIWAIPIDKLEISFTDYQPGSKLSVDWIRLVGASFAPTPTTYPTKRPTPSSYPKMTPTPTPESYPTKPPVPTSYPTRTPTHEPFPTPSPWQ